MALDKFSRIILSAALLAIACAALAPLPVLADDGNNNPASKSDEISATGVYVKGEFTLPVIQQPGSNLGFVSTVQDTLTQFGLAAQYGNIGLLAHNYLAGTEFFDLSVGEKVYVFYGTRRIETYVVTEILKYQALDPYSPYSEFKDLATGATLTANDLFHKVYMGERHITFQTCIEQNGNSSWGRLFVIAEPLAKPETVVALNPGQ